MSRILRTLFFALLILSLQTWAQQHHENTSGLLWEITSPQQKAPSYLFGTIHSEDERVLALPPVVTGALQRSELFVMEMEMSGAQQQQANRRMLLPAGEKLSQLLDAPLYKQCVELMEQHHVPEQVTAQLKPWAVTMMLSMPKPRTGQFLDLVLYEHAMDQKKQVGALESVDEQLDALDKLPQAMQVELLRHTLAHTAQLEQITEQLIKAWLKRDLDVLERLADESNLGLTKAVEDEVQQRMVDQRNLRMVERMVPLMEKQASFVAVGALHLPGEQGIISLLRQRGYTVRAIY